MCLGRKNFWRRKKMGRCYRITIGKAVRDRITRQLQWEIDPSNTQRDLLWKSGHRLSKTKPSPSNRAGLSRTSKRICKARGFQCTLQSRQCALYPRAIWRGARGQRESDSARSQLHWSITSEVSTLQSQRLGRAADNTWSCPGYQMRQYKPADLNWSKSN